jgi:predicted alpha/beta superfamily hydrolase
VTRYRTLVGHSLGGLFALHVLATRPELFEKYIALSPVIPYAQEQVLHALAAKLPAIHDTISVYTAIGNEQEGFPEGLDHLEALLRRSAPASLHWKTERFPTLRHMEMVGPGVSNGINFVFGSGY